MTTQPYNQLAMSGLKKLTAAKLLAWVQQATTQDQGRVMSRIPQLALADQRWFAVHICCGTDNYSQGDTACVFPLMSVIKPFSLLYLLEHLGSETVFKWVGVEPSNAPFNSLEQLIADRSRPRNPMINSGAITLADKLPGIDASDRTQKLCQWLNQHADCQLQLDEAMLESVRSSDKGANQAIAHHLAEARYLDNVEVALDTYEQICCLSGKVADLAQLGKLLTTDSAQAPQHRHTVNALMLSCGVYEASFATSVRIGLPIKSGVSGAVLAIVPGQGAIACYSPALDSIGNPVAGLALIETLAQELQLNIFG